MLTPLPHRILPIALALCTTGAAQPADAAAFFGLDKSWDVHLTVTPKTLAAMYPEGRPRMGLSQRGRFSYVQAEVEIAGRRFARIGLRFKGNSTFWSTAGSLKRSFKLDFDRFEKDQHFLGLTKLNLQNNATDPSQVREAVAYEVYRRMKVPASRTAFARVFLTVTGEFERNYVGSYTVVEQVDRRFLDHRFGSKDGLIVKPEGRVMPFLGDHWHEDYDETYVPKTATKDAWTRPLIEMARLVADDDKKRFAAEIDKAVDVEEFLRYAAVTLYLANLDSPFMLAHNFYMAVPAKTGKVLWLPWDLNLALGGFRMAGSNVNVFRGGTVPLFDKVLAIPRHRRTYEKLLRELIERTGSSKAMAGLLDTARKTTAKAIAAEAQRSEAITKVEGDRSGFGGFGGGFSQMFRAPDPDDFVAGRPDAVRAQLERGTPPPSSSGGLFGMGRGGMGGFGARRPQRSDDRDAVLRRTLRRSRLIAPETEELSRKAFRRAVDALFARIDKNQSRTLKRTELAAILRAHRGEDFSPSQARRLLKDLDADKDRAVQPEEWRSAFDAGFAAWDADQNGRLSRDELAKTE